ncbi:LOW QUALITY PROTEIN: hypothetical protein Cgig2_024070 [Carnegiea gigantea]|uniref:Protein FAR1-RELATED SEQUENCE n=1 Tax=Carnegiea gigantea TaxID=171969 RepID=A0A9Q1K7H2_9CARY|nr:LOW QUALITY PROTEIN: hypothetical protein Cgig2_024070 [Carnegiea gigantea]
MEGKGHTQCFFDLNELPDNQELVEFVKSIMMNSIEDSKNFNLIQNLDLQNLQNSDEILHPVDNLETFVGQTFPSQEKAFFFYGNYARQQGFSIRKDRFVTGRSKGMTSIVITMGSLRPRLSIHPRNKEIEGLLPMVAMLIKVLFLPDNREIHEGDGKRILLLKQADPWMIEAIAKEMPMSKHSFCIHITSKFGGWFMSILRDQCPQRCANFYILYKLDTPEEFECQWPQAVGKYNSSNNKHFGCRPIFMRFVPSSTSLRNLAKQVVLAVQEIRQTQLHNNMVAKSTITPLRIGSPLEKQASQVFTPFTFQKLQEQVVRSSEYSILHINGNDFVLRHYGATSTTQSQKVFWDGRIAMCTYKHFEFMGMLCRHIFHTSSEQVIVRQDATLMGNDLDNEDTILCPPKSTTKGCPRKRCMKCEKELSSQTKTCSICGRTRHNTSTCPKIKENAIPNTT